MLRVWLQDEDSLAFNMIYILLSLWDKLVKADSVENVLLNIDCKYFEFSLILASN